MFGWMGGQMDERMDVWMDDQWTDGWMFGWVDEQTHGGPAVWLDRVWSSQAAVAGKHGRRLACGGEDSPDDAAEPHQEASQRHVLLAHRHHQGAGVVLHEDPRDAMAARRVVDHPLLTHTRTHTQS